MKKTPANSNKKSTAVGNDVIIFGGTSEGRVAVLVCDEAAKPYFYSTKNDDQKVENAHGVRISGGLNEKEMLDLFNKHGIKLIIDAAHPFAENVHNNIGNAAKILKIPVIRFERKFPPHNPNLHWFDDYTAAIDFLNNKKVKKLLALTGVNTISKLQPFWSKNECYFRIMKRKKSLEVVRRNDFPLDKIIFYDDEKYENQLFKKIEPDTIITKESGDTGRFSEKIKTALELNIPVLVIRRPPLPYNPNAVIYGKHGLRKQIEQLHPHFFKQRTGFTTGSCATAATKAALTALLTEKIIDKTTITLPNEEPIQLTISKTVIEKDGSVTSTVIKDSGDDPDVTNGTEICSNVKLNYNHSDIQFLQGVGVGKVTLPGLGLTIGSPAINRTPREMIKREVSKVLEKYSESMQQGVDVTISVPDGETLAKKTFNGKLGILGGISIIGTSGIVKPYSSEAFVNSIRREIDVAKALKIEHLVLNSGAKSEKFLKALYPSYPPQSFIQYGNYIGKTLSIADEKHFSHVTLGIMIGKAVKLAEGKLDTHSRRAEMNRLFIQSMAREANCSKQVIDEIADIKLARSLWQIIPDNQEQFFQIILKHCKKYCQPLYPNGELTIMLIKEDGKMISLD